MFSNKLNLAATVSWAALALMPTQVYAQTGAPVQNGETAVEQAESGGFGEIIVTANKRSQNLQDVPISVSAYSGEQISQLGITDTTEITQQIPGLQMNAWSPNLTIFSLRGISQNNFNDNLEAPVAVYMDNAYIGSINAISGQLFDTERVEVLRGPQGTLFGRNATGGLIHYISRDASETYTNGYVEAKYGRFNDRSLEGALGGSFSDAVRFRLAGRVEKADGYVKSAPTLDPTGAEIFPANGQDLGSKNGWAGRLTLQFEVTPDLLLNLSVKHSRDNSVDTGGYVFENCDFQPNGYCHVNDAGLSDGTGGVINGITGEPASPFQNFGNKRGNLDRRSTIAQADFTWDLGGVELTSITNALKLKKQYEEDGDAIPVDVINFFTAVNYKQFSQEVRLAGESDALNWQLGAYYLDIDLDGSITTVGAPVLGAAFGLNGNAVDPSVPQTYDMSSKNWSIFGQGDYNFTDQLSLTLGGRYSVDTKNIDYLAILTDPAVAPDQTLASSAIFEMQVPGVNHIRYKDWAARVSLNYKPDDDTLVFLSWNKGIKGGNWSLGADVVAPNFKHRPETLYSYELGFKTSLMDSALRLNGTVFYYDYKDYQAFAVTGGIPQASNSDATSKGAELELFYNPSERFNAILGAAYQTSKVKDVQGPGSQFGPEFFPGAPDAQFCTNQNDGSFFCDFPVKTIQNAEFPNAPKFSLNYLLRYNFDMAGGNFAAQVDGAWYAKQFLEVTNGASSLQPAYNITNASLSWTDDKSGISLNGWVHNVFDKEYRAYTLNLGILGTTSFYAPPRTYGATLRIPFGS